MQLPRAFENREVAALVEVPARALRYWADRGVVVPEVADAVGRPGVRRRYSFPNLVECGVVRELLRYGINLHQARGILAFLRKSRYFTEWPGECFLIVQDGKAVGTILGELRPGHRAKLTARFPKGLRRFKPGADLGTYLEQILREADAEDSFLVVAVHEIRDRLAARVGVPVPRAR